MRKSLIVPILVVALAAVLAASTASARAALVPSTWDCTNGDVLTFNLPAVAISPGQGALTAPYPGFLAAVDVVGKGQTAPPLGTYLVLAVSTPDGFVFIGQKTGLAAGALTCTLEGTDVTVIISAAAH